MLLSSDASRTTAAKAALGQGSRANFRFAPESRFNTEIATRPKTFTGTEVVVSLDYLVDASKDARRDDRMLIK